MVPNLLASPSGGSCRAATDGGIKINVNFRLIPPIRPIGHLPPEGEGVLSRNEVNNHSVTLRFLPILYDQPIQQSPLVQNHRL